MKFCMETPEDFSLYETVHAHGWRALAPFGWQEETGTLERIERLDAGQVVLLTVREPERGLLEIEVSAETDSETIAARVRRMLQMNIVLEEFHAFCAENPKLAHVPEKRQGRLLRAPTLWEDTVKVILTTNTTWTQTKVMTTRFVQNWGEVLPSDNNRRAFPTPQRIAATELEEFASQAKVGYRAGAIHELAVALAENRLALEAWQEEIIESESLRKRLLALRGVGPYSASCLMLYLGKTERVNVDSWARTLVSRELGRPVTDAEVHAFFEPYGAWRGLAYNFYAWREPEPDY